MSDPYIVGWAHTAFGRSEAPDTEALMAEVTGPALTHAGVAAEDVDGIFVGGFNNVHPLRKCLCHRLRSIAWGNGFYRQRPGQNCTCGRR